MTWRTFESHNIFHSQWPQVAADESKNCFVYELRAKDVNLKAYNLLTKDFFRDKSYVIQRLM